VDGGSEAAATGSSLYQPGHGEARASIAGAGKPAGLYRCAGLQGGNQRLWKEATFPGSAAAPVRKLALWGESVGARRTAHRAAKNVTSAF